MNAELYERMWSHDAYRATAPGEDLALRFVDVAKPKGRVIDFGAGTGRGAALIQSLTGVPVLALDFAANALDPQVREVVEFRQHDLRQPVGGEIAPFGYCTDVLEHIAPEDVDAVLINILQAARRVFFSISTLPDHFGPVLAGEPLHLTVQPHAWWRERLKEKKCRIFWEREVDGAAQFFVSGYLCADDLLEMSVINEAESLVDNIKRNASYGLRECGPHAANEQPVMLLGGGPSLADHEAEIIERAKAGEVVVTTNGTYNWCLERGIEPAAQVLVDARAFNARFVTPVIPRCKYLVCAQANPDTVALLPKEQTYLWYSDSHVTQEGVAGRQVWPVYGGSTVMLRAIPLLAMLGFRRVEVFGWDSCLRGDAHHAYSQPENDMTTVFEVVVGGRAFQCHPWMYLQAQEAQQILRAVARVEDFELAVRGDGLIAHIIETAANAAKGN